ncbi:MAG: dephospho-CoA kinase [Bacteroidia bacterium]
MIKVGITGGIGSGKSTVCKVFELLGVPIFYADAESQKLLQNNKEIQRAIIKLFGNDILSSEGLIDRKKIAAIVFNDVQKLRNLNEILHPAVFTHFENWVKKQVGCYVIKEAAILFESGANKQVDKIITVTCPIDIRINRVIKRDGVTYQSVEKRILNQRSDEEKVRYSQFVINNDERNLIIPQILFINRQLLNQLIVGA